MPIKKFNRKQANLPIDIDHNDTIYYKSQQIDIEMVKQPESIGGGAQRECHIFTSDDEKHSLGIWESTAFHSEMRMFSYDEYAIVIDGEVCVTDSEGREYHFLPDDVIYITKGTVCSWHSDNYFKKVYYIQYV